jgi:antibiotic biosynthesis monooxygenase (ABM) superfamily enzyme
VTLVAILTVRPGAVDAFRAFERRAAAIMSRYGGAIERTVVVPGDGADAPLREVHVVTFPDRDSLAAYRADADLAALAHLREASVARSEILVGEDGPDYTAA